ncbi:MAG: GmrSD restriction endonuclease domain-containing protein, partial [Prochlorothrix sp.]
MKATEAKLLAFLQKSPQFIIPIYQRTYSWTEQECRQLWNDILRAGQNEEIAAHFIGSVVYIEKGLYQVSSQSPLLVIDGQQRLTTVSLLLEALARHIQGPEPVDGFSAKKIRSYYLLNPLEEGDRGFKLLLTQTDKDTLLALVQQQELPKEYSIRVQENFKFFEKQIADCQNNLVPLCNGIAKLVIVDIALSRDQDNPQLIFESMNSTGRELSQADLIRNFILMGLEPAHQTRLYESYWRPMELEFGQEAYSSYFDSFMRHYLTVKTGDIPNLKEVYQAFKKLVQEQGNSPSNVDVLVADLRAFAKYYCAMALGKETDKALALAFRDLRELKVEVAYPFLLELYHDYQTGILSREHLLEAVRLTESYVFRRAVCAIPTNSMNKTFANLGRSLKKDRYLESIQAYFMLLPSYRRFPKDEEFKQELKTRDLYNFRSRSYWLRRLENYGRKEKVVMAEYTIEHILPQNENLSMKWQQDLGPDWQTVQQTWLHTLGNLTLTGYNSPYSDRPFSEKRDMEGGFKQSPLKLNAGLGAVEIWNEVAIQERAERLSQQAIKVWSAPDLDPDVLDAYRLRPQRMGGYGLDDHPFLKGGAIRKVFEAFRAEVLALDPCVSEEFLKLYVAYKAETNFVDVVPQAKRLRLSFNMRYPEIDDPKGICRDVTNLGRW